MGVDHPLNVNGRLVCAGKPTPGRSTTDASFTRKWAKTVNYFDQAVYTTQTRGVAVNVQTS